MSLATKGSLSNIIVVDPEQIKNDIDEQYILAETEGNWSAYCTSMHIVLTSFKAKSVFPKLNFKGATDIITHLVVSVLPSIEDSDVKGNVVDHLEEVANCCEDHSSEPGTAWHEHIAGSNLTAQLFVPTLNNNKSTDGLRTFILKRVLHQVKKIGLSYIVENNDLLCAVIEVLKHEMNPDVKLAQELLVMLGEAGPEDGTPLFRATCQDALKNVSTYSDSAKFNVYDVMEKLSLKNSAHLSMVSNSGWIDDIVKEVFNTSDPLKQLATLQSLTNFMESKEVTDKFIEAGIFGKLQEMMGQYQQQKRLDDPVLPGLMNIFVSLGNKRPELVMVHHAPVMDFLLTTIIESEEDIVFTVAFENLVTMITKKEGKALLASQHKDQMKLCLEKLVDKLRKPPVELRDRYLVIVSMLFTAADENSSPERIDCDELSNTLFEWYCIMFPCKSISVFEKILKLPFNNLHLCTLQLLITLLDFVWGAKMIFASESLLENLRNRHSENTKEGKELKYQLVKKLMSHTEVIDDGMSDKTRDSVNEFLKHGPLYVKPFVEDMDMMGVGR